VSLAYTNSAHPSLHVEPATEQTEIPFSPGQNFSQQHFAHGSKR
jgi:hypothetical protein